MNYFDDLRIHSVSKCITRGNGIPGKNEFLVIGLMLRGPAILCTPEWNKLLQTPFLYWSQGHCNGSYWRTPPCVERENIWILGEGPRLERMVAALNELNHEGGYYCHLKNPKNLAEVFERLRNAWERRNNSEKYRLPLLLEELMATIGETTETDELSSKMSRLVKKTAASMVASPEKDFDMTEIAHVAEVSSDYFRHCFQQHIGTSPYNYLLAQRYALSVRLLRETSRSISDISETCGFSEQRLFTYFFKKRSGLSPREFRKRTF